MKTKTLNILGILAGACLSVSSVQATVLINTDFTSDVIGSHPAGWSFFSGANTAQRWDVYADPANASNHVAGGLAGNASQFYLLGSNSGNVGGLELSLKFNTSQFSAFDQNFWSTQFFIEDNSPTQVMFIGHGYGYKLTKNSVQFEYTTPGTNGFTGSTYVLLGSAVSLTLNQANWNDIRFQWLSNGSVSTLNFYLNNTLIATTTDTTYLNPNVLSIQTQQFMYQGSGSSPTDTMLFDDVLLQTVVPEPATWALLAGGLTTVMAIRRRRK